MRADLRITDLAVITCTVRSVSVERFELHAAPMRRETCDIMFFLRSSSEKKNSVQFNYSTDYSND
jgi:hypothetical protein